MVTALAICGLPLSAQQPQRRWVEMARSLAGQQPQAAPGPNAAGTYITIDPPGSCGAVLEGINSRREMIGFYYKCGLPYPQNARNFLFSNGRFTDIAPPPGCVPDAAFQLTEMGINEEGDVVGTCIDSVGVYHGFLLSMGRYTSINPPGAGTYVETAGINPAGDIVGWFSDNTGASHGFLFRKGSYTNIDAPASLGAAPGSTVATAINPQGDIVGGYTDTSALAIGHGFLLSHGGFANVDVPGAFTTYPLGINAQGDIVGWACCGNPGAFLVTHGKLFTINLPASWGATFASPYGINSQGDIVGYYVDSSGNQHGFLLTKN
jgi:probable HAF family extracellular repeat protein